MDEQRLITGCKRGEQWARREVYEKYAPAMLSLCVRYVADYEAARDVLQDGFVRVFTKTDQYEGKGNFGGWIRQIFVNTALEYLRKQNYLQTEVLTDELNEVNELQENENWKMSADDLMECISELPDRLRTVFNMYAIEGFSHGEIAAMTGIQESTSRSHFLRARLLLQQKVTELLNNEHAGKK